MSVVQSGRTSSPSRYTGATAQLQIEGLGGSYGAETLTYHRMLPEMGPPETKVWEYPGKDASWRLELEAFVQAAAAETGVRPPASLYDAKAALEVVQNIYGGSPKS